MQNKLFDKFKKPILFYFIIFLFIVKIEPYNSLSNNCGNQSINQSINQFWHKSPTPSNLNSFLITNKNDQKKFVLSDKNSFILIGTVAGESIAAFTLAEVLITLTVIGVVASMAIPSLMNSINDAELKTQWKKMYATMSQTIISMKTDNGTVDYGTTYPTGITDFTNTFLSYYKVKYQSLSSPLGWHWHGNTGVTDWYTFDGTGPCTSNAGYPTAILQDGTMMYFTIEAGGYYSITVDINGNKLPNRVGKDIFAASVDRTNGTLKPAGSINTNFLGSSGGSSCFSVVTTNETCDSSHVGWGCSARLLLNQ